MRFLLFFLSFLASASCATLWAQNIAPKPAVYKPINDYVNLLSEEENKQLSAKLIEYEDSSSTQIVIVIIDSLAGIAPETYAQQWAESWGIGQKGADNGLLLLLSMKDRKIRIEVGYGLEDKLTDAFCNEVINNILVPKFRALKYSEAINIALDELIKKIGTDYSSTENRHTEEKKDLPIVTESLSSEELSGLLLLCLGVFFGFLLQGLVAYFAHYKKGRKIAPILITCINLVLNSTAIYGIFHNMDEDLVFMLLIVVPIISIFLYLILMIPKKLTSKIIKIIFALIMSSMMGLGTATFIAGKNLAIAPIVFLVVTVPMFFVLIRQRVSASNEKSTYNSGSKTYKSSTNNSGSYQDSSSKYSDYSDTKYSDYSDTSNNSFGGGSSGGGGASGSW